MRDARAIVNRLLEVHQPDEDLDWSPDPQDPDQHADPKSAYDVPMTFPGVGRHEPLVGCAANYERVAKPHTGGYTQRTGFYRPSQRPGSPGPTYFTFPHGTRIQKVDDRTFIVYWPDGAIGVQLHGTVILKRDKDGNYVVHSGGWKTPITMRTLDRFLPFGWSLAYKRKNGEFLWINQSNDVGTYRDELGRVIQFTDGDKIMADGTLVPEEPPKYRNVTKKRHEPPAE